MRHGTNACGQSWPFHCLKARSYYRSIQCSEGQNAEKWEAEGFTLRLTRDLDAAMRAKAAETREDISDFIRAAIRHSVLDYRAPSSADLADMRRLWCEFMAVSRNINQMAHAANQVRWGKGGTIPEVEAMEAAAWQAYQLTYGIEAILRKWA